MIKKLSFILLFSLKIISSDLDPSNCLTCYASSCLVTFSALIGPKIAESMCIELPIAGCSFVAYKAGESCHEKCVHNFDSNNSVDIMCAKTSGLITGKLCLESLLYAQCPSCLPLITVIGAHNLLKIAEESMTDSMKAPYNNSQNKVKKIDEME